MESIKETELLKVFPQGAAIAKRLIREINRDLDKILDMEYRISALRLDYKEEYFLWLDLVDRPRTKLEKHKKRLSHILRFEHDASAFLETKERVKTIPIGEYVEFNGFGFAKCLWHEEKTPSMKWNRQKNFIHCFGCGINADIIDVVKRLNNCSFKEALSILSR